MRWSAAAYPTTLPCALPSSINPHNGHRAHSRPITRSPSGFSTANWSIGSRAAPSPITGVKNLPEPLGADFQIALNEAEQARCAETICDPDHSFLALLMDTDNPIGRAWKALPEGADLAGFVNSSEGRTWGTPNVGFGNPRGLARVYVVLVCGGEFDGERILSEAILTEATTEIWNEEDAVFGVPVRHELGFLLSGGALEFTGTPDTFAGLGVGGYVGVGVPSCRLGFACVGNRMAHALDEGPLSKTLMNAMMSCF